MWVTKKELKSELENAEMRALTHFQKLNQIEVILKNADVKKEMYYETINKIKRVIFTNANLNK